MLHLLLGIPSENIASAPFISVTLSVLILEPDELQLNINPSGRLFILPSVSAYVGSDTTAAVLSTEMHKTTVLLWLILELMVKLSLAIIRFICMLNRAGPAFEGEYSMWYG